MTESPLVRRFGHGAIGNTRVKVRVRNVKKESRMETACEHKLDLSWKSINQ